MRDGEEPSLVTPLKEVLGGRTATAFRKASLVTVSDLLRYYPRKYSQRGKLTDLTRLRAGEPATLWARIKKIETVRLQPSGAPSSRRPKHLTRVHVTDGNRTLVCAYFNQPWIERNLGDGAEVLVSGKVSEFRGTLQMSSPELGTLDGLVGDAAGALDIVEEFAGGIIPVYPLTTGLSSALLQRSVKQVLAVLGPIDDPLPETLRAQHGLMDLESALRHIHRPGGSELLEQAKARLRYDEALALQLVLARRRAEARAFPSEPCPRLDDGLLAAFDVALPFTLTDGQREVGEQIAGDLATIHPMNRLLQGEVGSGKTVVALRAMLQVIDAGRQAAMLAPTEVLAGQHARSLRSVLGDLGRGGELGASPEAIAVTLLTGSTPAAVRRKILLDIASGQPCIVVGTHALLSDDVMFSNLGLAVVDEQHRFGVEQRDALRSKDAAVNPPHVLVMTATPIPRTVAMTVYGDLDTSTLTQLPVGRAGVATTVVPAAERPVWLERAWQRIREEVSAGHQAYVVCPKIGEADGDSDSDGDSNDGADSADSALEGVGGHGDGESGGERRPPLAVLEVAEHLRNGPLAGLRIEVLHGRMASAEKDTVMQAFSTGEIDVLTSTTVIEVGVDVANASVMMVMDAERFGMSQLHQLRGRVGRGSAPGVCLLVTEAPAGTPGRDRLDAVAATSDGFELAEADLNSRREGDVLGASQAGRASSLKLLSLQRDRDLIGQARDDATSMVGDDASLAEHPGLAAMADAIVDSSRQEFLQKG